MMSGVEMVEYTSSFATCPYPSSELWLFVMVIVLVIWLYASPTPGEQGPAPVSLCRYDSYSINTLVKARSRKSNF
jgi:hypothetical protein